MLSDRGILGAGRLETDDRLGHGIVVWGSVHFSRHRNRPIVGSQIGAHLEFESGRSLRRKTRPDQR